MVQDRKRYAPWWMYLASVLYGILAAGLLGWAVNMAFYDTPEFSNKALFTLGVAIYMVILEVAIDARIRAKHRGED